MQLIPESGLVGTVALREARATELGAVVGLVEKALADVIFPGRREAYVNVAAMYPDRAVVRRDGRLYAYPYTLADNNVVELGQPTEVVQEHLPVTLREAQGDFLEAQSEQGLKWRIRVIRAGLSGNRNFYPDVVLREAAALFNGARVFEKSDEEHIKGKGKSFKQLVGQLSNAVFVEGKSTDSGEIQADLDVLSSSGDAPAKMLEAFQRGMAGLFGFSIDADGSAKRDKGRRVATKISRVNSVDLIIEPGAGGQLINLIEAINPEEQHDMALRERMIEAVKKAHKGSLPEGLDTENDEALEVAYREALTNNPESDDTAGKPAAGAPAVGDVDQKIRMVEARADMKVAIAGSGLPDVSQYRLRNQFNTLENFTEAQVAEAITAERDYLANFTESGRVSNLDGGRIEAGEDRSEKVTDMLDAFFDRSHKDHRSVQSFKECYVEITGDSRVTGDLRNCNAVRMREALGGEAAFREAISSGTFSNVLGDAITRAMIADYRVESNYDVYKALIGSPVPVNDFRTQERTRFGGYGDLPAVAENGSYDPLSSPTDEKATYAVGKKGGTETISLETIKDDDVGLVRRIPTKLSRAAKRTLSKFVLDFIRLNPTIYDAAALFHASHNNLGAAALSGAAVSAGRLAMKNQTELDSGDKLSIGPRYLWVPDDLEEAAVDMFRRNTENDKTFVQSLTLEVMPVWYWTDANDWALTADPFDVPFIELGFLDGNEEPELFVQDNPSQGSLFTNDQIKYKIRHIYGGNALDFRPAYKSVVV